MPDDDKLSLCVNPFVGPSAGDDFRPDAGRIAHRDRQSWFF
jgi:hypothetical protein